MNTVIYLALRFAYFTQKIEMTTRFDAISWIVFGQILFLKQGDNVFIFISYVSFKHNLFLFQLEAKI